MPSDLTRLFDEAQALHQAGRFAESRVLYEQTLAADPSHADSLHMLGVMAYQTGRNAEAVTLLEKAAALDPLVPSLHSNLGLALQASERLEEAVASFRRALRLAPRAAAIHNNLGNALLRQDQVEAAAASYAEALALDPMLAEARANLGEALDGLAMLALARGDAATALGNIRQSLAVEETPRARRHFADIAQALRWPGADADFCALLMRALDEGWGAPAQLAQTAAEIIKHRLELGSDIAGDALLRALLCATPNRDVALERMLTAARRDLLARALNDDGGDLTFAGALARQCFINEYVFCLEDGESAKAEDLRARLSAAIDSRTMVPPLWVVAVSCYFPLASLPGAARLQARAWPQAVSELLIQQLDEPTEEQRITAAIPRLTSIGGSVSQRVREQYEENPYPRWVRLAAAEEPVTLGAYLQRRFPLTALLENLPDAPTMLVAGCGTGRFALEMARKFRSSGILAVDLSLTSLGYAARKAEEAGVSGIVFAQADILQLGTLGRRFDVIESSGVLHHMADPFTGWRALLACLAPGGVMLLGLYSQTARRPVAEARAWIAREGLTPTPDAIRQFREHLMDSDSGGPLPTLGASDFFSISACRDLLFHVQERCLTLDEIAAFLEENGLALLGFETGAETLAAYRARFPDDPAATHLGHWRDFEADNPQTFANMYQFWVQRHE